MNKPTIQRNPKFAGIYCASMGKLFAVSAICPDDESANEFCRKHKDVGVMSVDANGNVLICDIYGSTIPSKLIDTFRRDRRTTK